MPLQGMMSEVTVSVGNLECILQWHVFCRLYVLTLGRSDRFGPYSESHSDKSHVRLGGPEEN